MINKFEILQHIIDESDIRRKIALYCRAVDRGDAGLLRSLYHENAEEIHGSYRGGIDGFIQYAQDIVSLAESTAHHITSVIVDICGTEATSESYFISISSKLVIGDDDPVDLVISGRYLDKWLQDADGAWKISKRKVVQAARAGR